MELEFDSDDEITSSRVEPSKDFVEASRFSGAREGYVFKAGDCGIGYYRDERPSRVEQPTKKRKAVSFVTERKVDASETVGRIVTAIEAGKRKKGLEMLATVVTAGGLTRGTAPLFFRALQALLSEQRLARDLVDPVAALLDALLAADVVDGRDRDALVTWHLSCSTARRLDTDDTYDFAAAIKRVIAAARAVVPDSTLRAAARRDAILHCLEVAMAAYDAKPWARTPVETAVLAAADHRMSFRDAQRDRLDTLVTTLRSRQRSHTVRPAAAARAGDMTQYHPLRNLATPR